MTLNSNDAPKPVVTTPLDTNRPLSSEKFIMRTLAHNDIHGSAATANIVAYKQPDNVVGMFPAPGAQLDLFDARPDMSLNVSAARIALSTFEANLAKMGIRLIVSDEALNEIVKAGIDAKYGAQPVQKTIEMQIEFPLSQAVLQGRFTSGDTIMVLWENGGNTFMK
jgi:hypothetical protein